MRFCLDNKYDRKEVISIGIKKEIYAQLFFVIIVIINFYFNIIPIFNKFPLFLILLFFSQRIYTFLSQLSRGLDKVSSLAIAGVINTVMMLMLNILFLLIIKLGIKGFFLANILSNIIPSLYMFINLKVYKKKFLR